MASSDKSSNGTRGDASRHRPGKSPQKAAFDAQNGLGGFEVA